MINFISHSAYKPFNVCLRMCVCVCAADFIYHHAYFGFHGRPCHRIWLFSEPDVAHQLKRFPARLLFHQNDNLPQHFAFTAGQWKESMTNGKGIRLAELSLTFDWPSSCSSDSSISYLNIVYIYIYKDIDLRLFAMSAGQVFD